MNEEQNIEDEQLSTAGENNSTGQTIEQSGTDIIKSEIPTSEISNMEVHHHPDLHHKPKPWKEYLLEFLMIFLAVTLGFIAESLREYITEHKHAKEYAQAMISDLSSDTADLKSYIKYTSYAEGSIDTLLQLISVNDPMQIPSGKLYWYGLWGGAHGTFVPHDATIHQMESSGSLRYFTNASLNRNVAQYDQLCRRWEKLEEIDIGIYTEVRKARAKIFESKYNDAANNIYQANKTLLNREPIDSFKILDSFMKTNPPLLTYDKTLFNEYLEMVRSRFLSNHLKDADTLMLHATVLITELKKEYHLQ